MKYRSVIPGHEKGPMVTKSLEREKPTCGSVLGGKRNCCVIFPANVSMIAESVERRNNNWFVRTQVASDLMVQVGENSFHLHKLPMVSRSGFLNRLVFERRSGDTNLNISIDNLPGGSGIFELVVMFCYGWKVNLTATNIAPLYCAAHFLEMSDDLEQGNLVSKTEVFLSFVIFSSWKDTFRIFKSFESISSWARDLQILKRCSEAIAWKACTDPGAECLNILPVNAHTSNPKELVNKWWFEDVSFLRIDHFIEVIASIKRKGMKPEIVGSCIAHWTAKWFSRITFKLDNLTHKDHLIQMQRVSIESLVRVLPVEEKSVSCNFLLHLLKMGQIMKIDSELLNKIERRTAFMLESCRAKDLLVKNYGHGDTDYDIGIVIKVVKAYASFVSSNSSSRIFVVGRLVDEYLTQVARNENVRAKDFQSLVEALPNNARYCYDNLYRAIDMYLKAHPSLAEEERSGICRAMEYQKLSQEARNHAMKNDRLPTDVITRFILLEQINMTRSIVAAGSDHRRTKSQEILRARRRVGKGWMNFQKEMKMMKRDVETMKVQLNELQLCRMQLQRHP
ncbi:hypothetical protein F0562_029360 [Nyssa sinensis]|uniref:NPH3 domain-containing protein n=1 Tax=Nyssa sinensis TaxID=561372 RepID=A0A5J5B4T4_9ASTE|nr:hypothetical protein F0562_029360 [Nyssa sinensis]